MPTPPPILTPVPTPPTTADPVNFDARMDAMLSALPTLQTEQNALSANVYSNAQGAQTDAGAAAAASTSAATSAALAAGYAGATLWVSGTAYALGAAVRSPLDGRIYRRIVAGAGTTDPSADAVNWKIDNNAPLLRKDVAGTAQAGLAGYDYWANNVAATTLTLPPAPADGDGIAFTPTNGRKDNAIDSGTITVRGPVDTAVGIFLLDLGARMQLKFSSTVNAWVVV